MSAKRTKPEGRKDKGLPLPRYIAETTRALASLARYDGYEKLALFLDVAAIEAEITGGVLK
jgi:hypothetical protein